MPNEKLLGALHVSKGNHMISSAIWNKWARLAKLHELYGLVQFVVFEKIYILLMYIRKIRDSLS